MHLNYIISKEYKENFTTSIMWIFSAILILLFVLNSFITINDFNSKRNSYLLMDKKYVEALKEASDNLHDLTFYNHVLMRPPSFINTFSERHNEIYNAIEMDFFRYPEPTHVNKKKLLFNDYIAFNWTTIILLIVSFFTICFSYNQISGEKEHGTLKLMLSNHIPRWQIFAGKYIGILLLILTPLITGIIINILIVEISPLVDLVIEDYLFMVTFIIFAIVFISFNILVGFLISSLTARSITSLSFILIFWVFFNLVIPNTVWLIVQKSIKIPTKNEIESMIELKELEMEQSPNYSLFWSYRWRNNPPHEQIYKLMKYYEDIDAYKNRIWGDYHQKLFTQTDKAIKYSKLSPFSVFGFMSMSLSNESYYAFRNHYRQAGFYYHLYKNFIKNKDKNDKESYHLIWNDDWTTETFMSNKPVNFDEIPKYKYTSPKLLNLIQTEFWDLFILLFWNVFLFLLSLVALNRYDVR